MIYEETIALKDEVSGPAKAASSALSAIVKSLNAVSSGLAKVANDAGIAGLMKYASAIDTVFAALQKIASLGAMVLPKAPGAPSAGKSASGGGKSAAGVAKPGDAAVPSGPLMDQQDGKLVFDPTQAKSALAAATQTKRQLEAAKVAMIKAAAGGDEEGFKKAQANVTKYGEALDKLPKPAGAAGGILGNLSKIMWNARNAMDVGRQTIGAAITSIGGAFKSLAAGDVKGAIQGATDAVAGLAKMLDLVVPGLGEAVSAVISIAGGIAGVTAGLVLSGAKMAIAANEAKAKWVSMFTALGEGAISGEATLALLDDLGDRIGQTREQLAPLAKNFMAMGITGKAQLESLTLAAASAGVMADGGAEAFTKLFQQANAAASTGSKFTVPYTKLQKQLGAMKLNIADVATAMGVTEAALTKGLKAGTVDAAKFSQALSDAATSKGAGPLARAGASLTNVWAKFQENISRMFEEIDVGPFLEQVKSLFDIFGTGKASANTLKAGIGGFFKTVFADATKVVPLVKHFLLDLVIYGLKAYLALKPIVTSLRDFFSTAKGSALLNTALNALWVVLKGVGLAIVLIVGVVAAFAAWMAVGVATAALFVGALVTLSETVIGTVIDAFSAVTSFLGNFATNAVQYGQDFVKGLVDGIASGGGMVVDAVKGLADGAVNSFKGALGIHSPSKVMMSLGGYTGEGFAQGLEAKAPDVHGSATTMATAAVTGASSAAAPAAGAAAAPAASGASGGSSSTTNNSSGGNTYNVSITGVKGAEDLSMETLSLAFEKAAMMAGVG